MRRLCMAALALALSACAQPKRPMTAQEAEWMRGVKERNAIRDTQSVPTFPVSLGCTGHGDVGYIHSYAVQEPVFGQFSRGMVSGLSCGGTVIAGYPVPLTWTPGMKVKVRWKPNGRPWVEKTTTIPYYADIGMLYVHFFPHDEVRVVVSQSGALNPHHPIPPTATEPPPEPD